MGTAIYITWKPIDTLRNCTELFRGLYEYLCLNDENSCKPIVKHKAKSLHNGLEHGVS